MDLHVTNFGRGALAFHAIDVLDDAAPATPIAAYRDSALDAVLQPVGTMGRMDANGSMMMRDSTTRRLDPGTRTVVYLWLTFPLHAAIPRVLRHRLLFDNLDSAEAWRDLGTQSAIDSIRVSVTHNAPLVLRPPVDAGQWLAGSGPSNTSDHRRSLTAVDGRAAIGQRFAINWDMVGPNGNTYHNDEHRNEDYWGFGRPVHAVAAGEVVAAVDSIADNTPHAPLPRITLANIGGNYVTIRIAPGRYATYAHLERGSVRVHPHQRVAPGAVLGRLGNSGQATAHTSTSRSPTARRSSRRRASRTCSTRTASSVPARSSRRTSTPTSAP